LNDISDLALVQRAQTGDRGAYETLITRYYRRVYAVCLGIIADAHDSQDLCQEALLQGYVKISRLRQADRFAGWLIEIAKNLCFDWLRKQKKNKKCIATLAYDTRRPKQDDSKRAVTEAVGLLPLELRRPLVMYYFDGRDSRAIAEQLGVSHSSIWRRLRQAKKRLHDLLSEVNYET